MFGLRMDAERVALLDQADLRDDAVGPFSRSLASSLPDGNTALSRDPEGRNPWQVVYVFTLQGTVVGFSSPSTLFCPAVHLPQPIQGMGWTGGGRFSDPVEFLGGPQRQALADWFSHVRNGMLQAKDLQSQTTAGQMAEVLDQFIKPLKWGTAGYANPLRSRPCSESAGQSCGPFIAGTAGQRRCEHQPGDPGAHGSPEHTFARHPQRATGRAGRPRHAKQARR